MTISTTTLKASYSGNGSTTAFAYTWKIFASTELAVYIRVDATGAETLKAEGTGSTNYAVSGVGVAGGGNVTFVTEPASGETVVILRDTALTQGTDYQPADPFPAADHEDALDKLTHVAQELQEELDRSFKVSRTTSITTPEFTDDATARASKLLGFSSDGQTLQATTGRVSSVSVSNVATSSGSPGTATASFTDTTGALALGIPIGQTGMAGGISMQYSTTTADADPGAGFIRLNNANFSSATVLYVDDSDGSTDISAWVQSWDDSDGANRGIVTISGNPNTASPIVTFKVTGAVTDASGYTKVPVAYLAGSTSASNNAEVSLAFSPAGSSGVPAGLGLKYSTTTTDSDPGAGYIRFNNGTLSSAAICYIDDADLAGADISGLVQSWDDSTNSALRGTITLIKETNAAVWATWNITGAATNASGYTKQALTYVAGTGSFSNDDLVRLVFVRSGNIGVPGGLNLTYSTTTTDSDPGAGVIRFDNSTLSSASNAYIDDVDTAGATISTLVQTWDDSTTTALRGTMTMSKRDDPAVWATWNVTGAATNASGYTKQALTYVAGTGSFSDTDPVVLGFVRTGNIGATGSTGSTGSTGATGSKGDSAGVLMAWETATADSDQGAGKVWGNNGTISSISVLYLDDVEAGGASINSLVDSWDDSTTTALRGTIAIYKNSAPANFHIFNVTGAVTSASTYSKIAVTYVQTSGTISDGDAVSVQFVRTGNAGGGMSSFTMSDGSTTQDVENGETQTFAAGEGIDVAVSATNTVTYSGEDASTTNKGVVELATDAEAVTGSDTARAVTPANVTAKMAAPGAIGGTTPASGAFTTLALGGALAGADNQVGRINLIDYGEVTNAIGGTGGGTQDIDLTLGNNVVATVDTSANTFTFSNPTASDELSGFTLFLTNGGSQTVNWPSSVDWPGGSAPTLTTSGIDILVFITTDGGAIWHGMVSSADSKTPS